jgi:uncharacterized protein YjdB
MRPLSFAIATSAVLFAAACADKHPLSPLSAESSGDVAAADGSCPAPDLLSHGFDDGTTGAFQFGWGSGTMSIVTDATATGGRAVRKQWTSGDSDAAEIIGVWAGGDKPLTKRTRRAYARFRFKQDAAFDNSGILNLVRFQAPGQGRLLGSLLILWGEYKWTWDTLRSNREMRINVGAMVKPDDLRGDWHTFEVLNDITTNGQLRMRLWIDGALKMDHTSSGTNQGYYLGTVGFTGAFNAPAANATSWIDELAVSTQCIGGSTTPAPEPVATVAVTLTPSSIEVGQTAQATAVARDANGNVLSGRAVTWSSSDPAVAAVNATGLVTGVAPGTAQITATSEGRSGSAALTVSATPPPPTGTSCASPGSGWIFCDDFEQDQMSRYFEWGNPNGSFARVTGVGTDGSTGMRARFAAGQVTAGDLKLAFGRTPDPYFRPVDAGTANYRDVYWRLYVRTQSGWLGGAGWKFTKTIVFANSNWAEAAVGHLTGLYTEPYLTLYSASGTDAAGNLRTTTYNDFANFRDLGFTAGSTQLFSTTNSNKWYCVEARMRLNDAGQSNGVFQYWIDGNLEAQQTGLNWVGNYSAYGINALFLENYNNDGAPQAQERYFDNVVVSTQRIGCSASAPPGPAPIATLSVTLNPATVDVGATSQAIAVARDASGNVLTGRSVTWSSSNTSVATVDASGVVTGRAGGSAQITAISEGVSGNATITVNAPAPTPIATVAVTLNPPSVEVNQTSQATAVARDAAGNVLTGRTVTWTSSNTTVATVSAGGLVTGRAAGTAQITATSEGKAGSATITVTAPAPAPVATVSVTLNSSSLTVGQSTQATATLRDASGNILTGRSVTWSSSNPLVASVTSSGMVTALLAGTAQITATSEGRSGSAPITVTALQPGSCPVPNLLSHGFDDGTLGPFRFGWGSSTMSIVSDATAAGGRSVRKVWSYGGSDAGEIVGVWAGGDLPLTKQTRSAYTRFRFKQDPTFDNSGILKLVRFQAPGQGPLLGTLIIAWNDYMWTWDTLAGSGMINVGAVIKPNDLRGSWHTFEVYNDISTSGQLRMKLWIDGVLKMDHTSSGSNQGYFLGTVDYNGTFNAPAANATSWIDELAVSTQCIGLL